MQCKTLRTYMETGRVVFLPVRVLSPNPAQPRRYFREEAMEELTESVRRHGILQPLSVRRTEEGYQLICGERRLRAARNAGLTEVPCILMQMDDQESELAAMVENIQRQDLNYVEEAQAISRLLTQWDMSQDQAARLLGKSQSSIANKLRLLRHSPEVLAALRSRDLTERHARALLKLPEDRKLNAIEEIFRQGMNVAQAEKYIDSLLSQVPDRKGSPSVASFLNGLNHSLDKMRRGGVTAVSERRDTGDQIVLTITIHKTAERSR